VELLFGAVLGVWTLFGPYSSMVIGAFVLRIIGVELGAKVNFGQNHEQQNTTN
jgi:hypothetical protein